MTVNPKAFKDSIEFIAEQNPHIKKIAKKFMNVLGINYFAMAHITGNTQPAMSTLNTDIRPAVFWASQKLPLPVIFPNDFYFASQFKTLFPTAALEALKEKLQRDYILFHVQHTRNGTHLCTMAGDPENTAVMNNYMNHRQDILDFQLYFLQETKKLRKESRKYSFHYDFKLNSQKRVSPAPVKKINYNGFSCVHDLIEVLSKQEFECLRLRQRGLSLKAIAHHLKLGETTVESYLDCARYKLHCDSRIEMLDLYHALLLG